MTTSIGGTRGDAAPQRLSRPNEPRQPLAERGRNDDVRAMSDAFAAARGRMKEEPTLFKGERRAPLPTPPGKDARPAPAGILSAAAFDRELAERQKSGGSERFADGQGLALGGQGGGALALAMPNMPSPQVDPGAFAQMLADLWTRENGKGAKEVRVRFGEQTWPATGAVLVRNAAGGLDVALQLARGASDPGTEALGERLSRAGLGVGALTTEYDG